MGAVPGEGGFGGMHLPEFGNKREECLPRDLQDTVQGTGHESSPNIPLQQVCSPGQGNCRRTPSAILEQGVGGRSGKGRWSARECVISPGPSEGRPQRELHITTKMFTL